jgi:hypothetical protein
MTLEAELHEQLSRLPIEEQRRVLAFARSLVASRIKGVPGKALLRHAGTIDDADLSSMQQAIEEACDRIDLDEW